MAKMPKKTCPWCDNQEYATPKKLLAGLVTRCCQRPFVTVAGKWYQNLHDAPEWRVIRKFVEMKQTRNGHYEIEYGKEAYKTILGGVKDLLARCGNSVELALLVVELSFTHKSHKWRDYPSFYAVLSRRHFPDALALAKYEMSRRAENDGVQARLESKVTSKQLEIAYARASI
jgi:hypothetical protein